MRAQSMRAPALRARPRNQPLSPRNAGCTLVRMKPKVLVPVDFSPASMRALEVAQELAPRLGAEVVLVQVCEPPRRPSSSVPADLVPRYFEERQAAARRPLELLAAAEGGLRHELRLGEPAEKILQAIRETKPLLVVMGTHGRRGIARLALGSVAERVIRESVVPVMTVRAPNRRGAAAPHSRGPTRAAG